MKLNKKGFTLVEVLAVIIILSIIMLILIPSVNHLIKENKRTNYETLKSTIINAAKTYASDYRYEIIVNNMPCENDSDTKTISSINNEELTESKITVKQLINKNYLKSPIKNPSTGQELDEDNSYVKIQYSCQKKDYNFIDLNITDK